MQSKLLFYTALLSLVLLGVWGLVHINNTDGSIKPNLAHEAHNKTAPETSSNNFESTLINNTQRVASSNIEQSSFDLIIQLVNNDQALEASNAINEQYSSLSTKELNSLKSALLRLAFRSSANSPSRKKNVLLAISTAFDDLDIWKYLGDSAVLDNDWNTAFDAFFRASELENSPEGLEDLLNKLVISSGHLRKDFEGNDDLISIKKLYRRLSDLHPNFQRFQYELAISNLALGETESAKQLLQLLVYDPELGEISTQTLARIASLAEAESKPKEVAAQEPSRNIRTNDIVVPLIQAGSSFLVDSTIDRKPARLLLDTGASITSLSASLIERLKLTPTGQSIRLSTANGITNARIYQVKQLQLGRLVLRDMLIAEIDLGNSQRFQGLLGTDALNQLKPKYSYLIDNQEQALIFRKR